MSNDADAPRDARTSSFWTAPLLALAGLPVLLTLACAAFPWSPVGINGIGLLAFALQALLFAFSAMAIVVHVCHRAARSAGWGGLAEGGLTLAVALLSGVAVLAYQNHDPFRLDDAQRMHRDAVELSLEQLRPALRAGDAAALREAMASQAAAVQPAAVLCALRGEAVQRSGDGYRSSFDVAFDAVTSLPSISPEQRKALLLIAIDEALGSADRAQIERRLAAGPALDGVNWKTDVQDQALGALCLAPVPWPLGRVLSMPGDQMAGALELLLAHGLRIDRWSPWMDAEAPLPDAVVAVLARSGVSIDEALQGAFALAERVDRKDASQLGEDRGRRVGDEAIARYVQALLDSGANPATKNARGVTAFDALALVRKRLRGAGDPSLQRTALLDDLQRRLCKAVPAPPAGERGLTPCAATGSRETT